MTLNISSAGMRDIDKIEDHHPIREETREWVSNETKFAAATLDCYQPYYYELKHKTLRKFSPLGW